VILNDVFKPLDLPLAEPVLGAVLLVVKADIDENNVHLDTLLRVHHVVLVYSAVTLDSSLSILWFPNEVEIYFPLAVFGLQRVTRIVRPVVMIIPDPDDLGARPLELLVIY
jgi:hypothetical protein